MNNNTIKKSTAVLLIISIVITLSFSLSSCKSKGSETETTSENSDSYYQDTYAPVESSSVEEAQSEQASSQQPETTAAKSDATTSALKQTQAQSSTPSPSAEDITGTATIEASNKTIVYPKALESSKKHYPVIVWANGTGGATSMYTAMLQKYAEAGYIVVADASVMTADGTSQRDSIDYIIRENGNSSSIFYNKVDTVNIGASGHSQGGRSCVNAAQADSRIKCIVSIAGASSAEEANGLKTPTLYLTGTADMIVISSQWVKPSYDASAGKAVYASLKGGVHTTCMTNPEKISGYAVSWFDAYLKDDKNAMNVFSSDGQLANDSAWQDFAVKN